MMSSATATNKKECPSYKVPLVRVQSHQKDTFGQWFLKCLYIIKIRGDPTTCDYIRSEVEYEALKAHKRRCEATGVKLQGDPSACRCAQLMEELEEVKERLGSVESAVWKHKFEVKSDVKKLQIVIDSSVLVPLLVGLLGVIIGVVVAGMWK
ncbi:unnamed protein product [Urochloa humidicola]